MINTFFSLVQRYWFFLFLQKTFSTIRHSYAFNRHFDSVSREKPEPNNSA